MVVWVLHTLNYFVKNVGFRLEDYVFFPRVGGGWRLRGGLELEFKSLDVFFEIIQKRDMSICFGWYYVKKIFVFIILFMIMFFFYKKSRQILQNFWKHCLVLVPWNVSKSHVQFWIKRCSRLENFLW